jgi:hypothetical protein
MIHPVVVWQNTHSKQISRKSLLRLQPDLDQAAFISIIAISETGRCVSDAIAGDWTRCSPSCGRG